MKLNKIFAALMMVAAVAFVACEKTPDEPQGPTGPTEDTTTVKPGDEPGDEPAAIDYLDGEMSVAQAIAALDTLASKATTSDSLVIRGKVTSVAKVQLLYGSADFYISDGTNEFYIYQNKGLNGQKMHGYNIKVGDIVTVKGKVQNYYDSKNSVNILEMKSGIIVRTSNTAEYKAIEEEVKTVDEILAIAAALDADATDNDHLYRVSGYITQVKEAFSADYGNASFYIGATEDATETFYVYRAYYLNNKKWAATDSEGNESKNIEVGDQVEVVCQVQNYKGNTPETNGGYVAAHTK